MNIQTLERLAKNPHYKLSAKQKEELARHKRKPMVEFGVPPIHNTDLDIHETGQERTVRTSKNSTKKKD